MFSRAAKSIVKTIGQRKYHTGEENIKLAMIGGAGEIGRSLSQMLKQSSKLDVLALYDVAALNKRFSTPIKASNFSDGEPVNTANSRMLTMLEKSRSSKGDHRSESLQESSFSNRTSNMVQNETEELAGNLRRLPIAEECATNHLGNTKMESQGHNAYAKDLQGPRVLAEMGPDKFRHRGGRIVSEIYRQFPDFDTCFQRNRCNSVHTTVQRRYSNIALFPSNPTVELRSEKLISDFIACPVKSLRNANKISTVTRNNNCAAEKAEKRINCAKKKLNMISDTKLDQIGEKKGFKGNESSCVGMQRCERKKSKAKRFSDPKIVEEEINNVIARSNWRRNLSKSKNWTIPAVLSDKKPKTLYGLVRQRRKPLTTFFCRFFDMRANETVDNYCTNKSKDSKHNKLDYTQNHKAGKELIKDQEKLNTKSVEGNKLNASTSVSDLPVESTKNSNDSMGNRSNSSRSLRQTENPISVQSSEMIEERVATSSNYESEIDAMSETNDSQSTLRRMSSKIALFLENLRMNRQKTRSMSSLVSYNLESLFVDEEKTPRLDCIVQKPFLLSSSDSDSKFLMKGKQRKIFGKKKAKKGEDICKKKKSGCKAKKLECANEAPKGCDAKRKESSKKGDDCKKKRDSACGDGDPCKPYRKEENQGPVCKKYQEECGEKDPCKKYWKEEIHGKQCKTEEDPCKKIRTPEFHGELCKQYRSEMDENDPCEKYWRDEIHGVNCKRTKQKKVSSCDKKREMSSSCDKKREMSSSCGKKSSCDKKKETSSCGKKKEETSSCTRKKEETSSCGKKKEETSCCTRKKEETSSCGKKKEEVSSCGKKKKKEEKSSCSKKEKGEKSESCPPVVRAPQCPTKDGEKSGGSGGGGFSSRKFSTFSGIIRPDDAGFHCDMDSNDAVKNRAIKSRFSYRETIKKNNYFDSAVFDICRTTYGEDSENR